MKNPLKPVFQAAKKSSTLELYIYDQIGKNWWSGEGVSAKDIADAIKNAGDFDSIQLYVNSPGGSVFEGSAIHTLLVSQGKPISARVDGIAASAAFTITMAATKIEIGRAAMMMLHNAWGMAMGESKDMRQTADLLDKIGGVMASIYARRSGQTLEAVQTLMDAETWLSPEEAVAAGFADTVMETSDEDAESMKALAAQLLARSKVVPKAQIPERFRADEAAPAPEQAPAAEATPDAAPAPKAENVAGCDCECPECVADDCADCSNDECDDDACMHATDDSDEGMRARDLARARLAEHVLFLQQHS